MTPARNFSVDGKTCIRCAACATVAPQNFSVRAGPARVLKPAETPREQRACAAAKLICPTKAISEGGDGATQAAPASSPTPTRELYPPVMEIAENVRWRITDLPWAKFDKEKATPGLVAVVREMAYSEQTTFSATQKFMQAFAQDADFSQWISVWFYEETKHPMALLKWLGLAGDTYDDEFVMKGRESEPFMPSLTGTLVTNIISEMVAAEAYLGMVEGKPEPLITAIATKLCGDEARHAASFFTYASRIVDRAQTPDREKVDALKVLHFWFNIAKNVAHPVNQAMQKIAGLLPAVGAPPFVPPNERIAQVVGLLIDAPITTPADLPVQLLEHTKRMREVRA
jgi:ferredoxin